MTEKKIFTKKQNPQINSWLYQNVTQTHRCDLLPSRWCQSAGYAAKEIKFDYFRYVSNFDPFHRNSVNTIIAAYFIYPNGTALTSDQVERMLSHPDHYLELRALGLTYIVSTRGPTCWMEHTFLVFCIYDFPQFFFIQSKEKGI